MPTVSGLSVTLADRVQETTQTTGTGTYSLDGAATGKRTFVSGVGNGVRTTYVASLGANWEIGVGTVTTGAPSTLSRDAILASTNSNNAVNWGAGLKDIFSDISAALANQIWVQPSVPIERGTISTTGTGPTFTGINSAAKVLEIGINGIGTNGNALPYLQLGDSGGIETSSYFSAVSTMSGSGGVTTPGSGGNPADLGIPLSTSWVANVSRLTGVIRVVNQSGSNAWYISGSMGNATATPTYFTSLFTGVKTLSAALTQMRLTTGNGTDSYNAGTMFLRELP